MKGINLNKGRKNHIGRLWAVGEADIISAKPAHKNNIWFLCKNNLA